MPLSLIVSLFHRAERRRQQTVPGEEVPAGDCQVHQVGAVRPAQVGGALTRLCKPLRSAIPGKICAFDMTTLGKCSGSSNYSADEGVSQVHGGYRELVGGRVSHGGKIQVTREESQMLGEPRQRRW